MLALLDVSSKLAGFRPVTGHNHLASTARAAPILYLAFVLEFRADISDQQATTSSDLGHGGMEKT